MLDRITPVVLTRDEEPNIDRCLRQLAWAADVVVVDSFSTDATVEIARGFGNARLFQRAIDDLAGQSNHGLDQVRTAWALLLDADFVLSPAFADELRGLTPGPGVHAYIASFVYAMRGRPLRASLYPPRVVLLERAHSRVWQDGHAHRVRVEGTTEALREPVVHDDRKSLRSFVQRQRRYMRQEADKLERGERPQALSSRVRRLVVVAPFAALFYTLVVKRLILDGWPGLHYAGERFLAEAILSWELIRRRLGGKRDRPTA